MCSRSGSISRGLEVACALHAPSFHPGNQGFCPDSAVAPGEIVSIFGSSLAATQVLFDGIAAPILYASPTQINAVVPYGVRAPFTQLTVRSDAVTEGPRQLPVVAAVPGIFTVHNSGTSQAAVINQDGTLNSSENPAAHGSAITFYATGAVR